MGIGIGSNSEIIFRSGLLKTNLTFSTRECFPGEIESGYECQPCLMDQYSFNTSSKCRDCEKHATCSSGSSLVPVDGYWHSTPFSPQFHECITREACKRTDRETALTAYYEDSEKISAEIATLNAYISNEHGMMQRPSYDDYNQCSAGYKGILCGACEAGYGHSAGGECIKCPNRGRSIRLTITSVAFNFVFLLLEVRSKYKAYRNIFKNENQADGGAIVGDVRSFSLLTGH